MTNNHEATLVNALAHHMALLTIFAVATCDDETASRHIDTAMDLWFEQHGSGDRLADNNLGLAALYEARSSAGDAIRLTATASGKANHVAAGQAVIHWAQDKGLGQYQMVQIALN